MKTVTLTLNHETEQDLRELAATQGGRSISSVVREAIRNHLDAQPAPAAPSDSKTGNHDSEVAK